MAGFGYLRYQIDIAIPYLDKNQKLPPEFTNLRTAIETNIKTLKGFGGKINEGLSNEESTIIASYHVCKHDTGKPCTNHTEI